MAAALAVPRRDSPLAPPGLVYYGCCEPVDVFGDDIRQLPHQKKASISRCCNQEFMVEALRGADIVFSRKPDPNFLSLDTHMVGQALLPGI